jgi:hypothetical protein
VIAAKVWYKLIAVVAANAIRRASNGLQRREDQRLVAQACLNAELRPIESENVDNVSARRVGNPILRHTQYFSLAGRVASRPKPSR